MDYHPWVTFFYQNLKLIKKLNKLLKKLEEHPTFGASHPKPLGNNRVNQWSRKITDKHQGLLCLFSRRRGIDTFRKKRALKKFELL